MLPEQQQRIMGYFIEEAKDHLNTIEQGLLNLQATIEDSERANEVFRAAHSVKGGAAMLGLESIQKTAHRMEDYFKVLKESSTQVDRALETMFLRISDGLKDLIEQLEGPFGLTAEKAQEIMAGVDPVFVQLEAHLKTLVADTQHSARFEGSSTDNFAEAIQVSFRQDVAALLRQMLAAFKQPDTTESRRTIQTVCIQLTALGQRFELSDWCDLTETARIAAANLDREYRALAPVLIKEIKNAQDLVLSGRTSEITVSDAMQSLLPEDILATELTTDLSNDLAHQESVGLEAVAGLLSSELSSSELPIEAQADEAFELNLELTSELHIDQSLEDDLFGENSLPLTDDLFAGATVEGTETDDASSDFDSLFSVGSDAEDFDIKEPDAEDNSDVASSESASSLDDINMLEEVDAEGFDSFEADIDPLSRLSLDLDFNEIPSELSTLDRSVENEEKADQSLNALLATVNVTGPDVGTEELNSLADLFDGDLEELDNTLGSHAFVSEEMRLSPEKIDLEEDDWTDLLAEASSEEMSDSSQIEDATANDAEEDLFGGTLTNGAFSTESSLEFDGFDSGDTLPAQTPSTADQLEGIDDVWGETELQDGEFDAEDSEVDTLFGIDAADGLFETAEADEKSTSEVMIASADDSSDFELFSERPKFEPPSQIPLTADEIAAQGIASSETLSSGFFSSQPISPSETEIEFPTLTGVKLKEAEEDIESFFFGDDASELTESSEKQSTQTAIEESEDLVFEEFEADGFYSNETDAIADDLEDNLDASSDLDISINVADIDLANADVDLANMDNEPGHLRGSQFSDDPWNEMFLEDSSAGNTENLPSREQVETNSLSAALSTTESKTEPDLEVGADVVASKEEVFTSDDDKQELSLDTLSLNLDETDVESDGRKTESAEDGFDSLFSSLDDINDEAIEKDEAFALDFVDDEDIDLGDEAPDIEGLLPEDLVEFEEAFGGELSGSEVTSEIAEDDFISEELSGDSLSEGDLSTSNDLPTEAMLRNIQALSSVADAGETEEKEGADASEELSLDDFLELDSFEESGERQTEKQGKTDSAIAPDDFDNLESLLAEGTQPAPAPVETSSLNLFESEDVEDEDFGDLERLLEDREEGEERATPIPARRPLPRAIQRTAGLREQNMRVPVKHLDNLSNLVGELVVSRNTLERDQERLRQFLDNLLFQVQQLNDVGQRMRDLYERSLLESSLVSNRKAHAAANNNTASKTEGHATGAIFDALEMDRFTGFHTLSQEMIELIVRVRESASDIGYTVESSDQVTRQFRQITTQLQEGLNTARMVPFSQASARLPRAIRDISFKCGKEAALVIEGEDTLIDKMIVENLYDPLTHLVNNAITHGIETPEQRIAVGKPPEGKITIKAFYQGNQTVIYVADDGRGIDPDFIKRKAIEKKLITPVEAEELSDIEAYELIFQPGFSTRDQADDFAGRGVGMDVVRTALAEIRGAITIDSELEKGTSFTIRLPLTLSISKALSCVSNQARIAFPMDGVEDMLDVERDRILKNDQDQDCVRWRDTLLPVRPVTDLLKFNRTLGRGRVYGGSQDDDVLSIIVLRSANTFVAVQVDQVIGEEEIVIKQLEGPVPKPLGIAGATILGDGRVMPIADVLELIDIAVGRVRREPVSMLWSEAEAAVEETPVKTDPTVLIVDDSITVRELLSMSFNKVGYRVEQARDGQEAWDKLRTGLPCDLVFCDIEMPRMDGLELLSRMQKDSQLKQIPIAMLTSRGADRHRQMAVDLGASGYFTKPYLEEALLDAAQRMLNGEVLEKGRGG